jgi:hypothetical protein
LPSGRDYRFHSSRIVTINPIGFFYDNGVPRGLVYETLEEFQKFANKTLKTGKVGVRVTFIPVRIDQLEAALNKASGTSSHCPSR